MRVFFANADRQFLDVSKDYPRHQGYPAQWAARNVDCQTRVQAQRPDGIALEHTLIDEPRTGPIFVPVARLQKPFLLRDLVLHLERCVHPGPRIAQCSIDARQTTS